MKPHGLNITLKEEILEGGRIVGSFEHTSKLEAWIRVENLITGKYIELPMRSFVSAFLTRIKGMFDGSGGAAGKMLNVSYGNTQSAASVGKKAGMLIGTGSTPVELSDTALQTLATNASLAYSTTTFSAPIVESVNPAVLKSEIRRLFQNNSSNSYYIAEVGIFGKALNAASQATTAGIHMLARDLLRSSDTTGTLGLETTQPINFAYDSDMRVDFKFKITHSSAGGLVLNFMKLIYNHMFKANANAAGSRMIGVTGLQSTYTFATSVTSVSSASPAPYFYLKGSAVQIYYGIVVGDSNLPGTIIDPPNSPVGGAPGSSDSISGDETSFDLKVDEFTCSANTVSAIAAGNKVASFTISRTFTNNATSSRVLRRVGILGKGNSTNGANFDTTQYLIAVNKPAGDSITIQPSQVYRVTYTFAVQV